MAFISELLMIPATLLCPSKGYQPKQTMYLYKELGHNICGSGRQVSSPQIVETYCRPAYLYRFSRDIPILALNHDFPISCGGVPILEDAGIFRALRFRFVLLSPVFPNPPRILHLPPLKALRCR